MESSQHGETTWQPDKLPLYLGAAALIWGSLGILAGVYMAIQVAGPFHVKGGNQFNYARLEPLHGVSLYFGFFLNSLFSLGAGLRARSERGEQKATYKRHWGMAAFALLNFGLLWGMAQNLSQTAQAKYMGPFTILPDGLILMGLLIFSSMALVDTLRFRFLWARFYALMVIATAFTFLVYNFINGGPFSLGSLGAMQDYALQTWQYEVVIGTLFPLGAFVMFFYMGESGLTTNEALQNGKSREGFETLGFDYKKPALFIATVLLLSVLQFPVGLIAGGLEVKWQLMGLVANFALAFLLLRLAYFVRNYLQKYHILRGRGDLGEENSGGVDLLSAASAFVIIAYFEALILAIPHLFELAQYSQWISAHRHLLWLGWVTPIGIYAISSALEIYKPGGSREWIDRPMVLLFLGGLVLYIGASWVEGVVESVYWRTWGYHRLFITEWGEIRQATLVYRLIGIVGGLMLLSMWTRLLFKVFISFRKMEPQGAPTNR